MASLVAATVSGMEGNAIPGSFEIGVWLNKDPTPVPGGTPPVDLGNDAVLCSLPDHCKKLVDGTHLPGFFNCRVYLP
jgi:hypothetical protein